MPPKAKPKVLTGESQYTVGERIFIACPNAIWAPAEVLQVNGPMMSIQRMDSEEILDISSLEKYYIVDPGITKESKSGGPDDLTQLTHLHEASVLECLSQRFKIDNIYTFTGPILIAVNPFKMIKNLYDDKKIAYYRNTKISKIPHLYAIANAAYLGICFHMKSQAILISGESGAGKTESTKYVMKFLAIAGAGDPKYAGVESRILSTNPLFESLGNAKTLRNDNSSRFGKFIELQFILGGGGEGYNARLCGASIQTYLLEKVRVCDQQEGERSFHFFYQVCAMSVAAGKTGGTYKFPQKIKNAVGNFDIPVVINEPYNAYSYLTKSSVATVKHQDEQEEFEVTFNAMLTVGLTMEEGVETIGVVQGVLSIGTLKFISPKGNSETSEISRESEKHVKYICSALKTNAESLKLGLTTRMIKTMNEAIRKPLRVEEAKDTADALARSLYGTLFTKIVKRSNEAIGRVEDVELFIGVLDIFGFECFTINSFEQVCINFTNERLQNFFNTFVFKLEEKLYKFENIPWNRLDFPDNQDCVELFQEKHNGIFAMLDEECVVPNGKDRSFNAKLCKKHETHKRFNSIRTKPNWFIVVHFAGEVPYCSDGFLEKNKDTLSEDAQEIVRASESDFVSNLFLEFLSRDRTVDGEKKKKGLVTVSSAFREQLNELMERVDMTEPHFIRCIKPNPQNKPDIFHRPSINEQLKYGGVLQAVQVSRAGYPVRMPHKDFILDYICIIPLNEQNQFKRGAEDDKTRCTNMMSKIDKMLSLPKTRDGFPTYAVGKTKAFLKSEAFELISTARGKVRNKAAVRIQSVYKAFVCRRLFQQIREATLMLQCNVRIFLAKLLLDRLRKNKAATLIQTAYRTKCVHDEYKKTVAKVVYLQGYFRVQLAKVFAHELHLYRAATRIQSMFKAVKAKVAYNQMRKSVVKLQLNWRKRQTTRTLRKIRELKEQGSDSTAILNEMSGFQKSIQHQAEHADQSKEIEKQKREWEMMMQQKVMATEQEKVRKTAEITQEQKKSLEAKYKSLRKKYSELVEELRNQRKSVGALSQAHEVADSSILELKNEIIALRQNNDELVRDLNDERRNNKEYKQRAIEFEAKYADTEQEVQNMYELWRYRVERAGGALDDAHSNDSRLGYILNENEMLRRKIFELEGSRDKKGEPETCIALLGGKESGKRGLLSSFFKVENAPIYGMYSELADNPGEEVKKWIDLSAKFRSIRIRLLDSPELGDATELLDNEGIKTLQKATHIFVIINAASELSKPEGLNILLKLVHSKKITAKLHLLYNKREVFAGEPEKCNGEAIMEEVSQFQNVRYEEIVNLMAYLENILKDLLKHDYHHISATKKTKEHGTLMTFYENLKRIIGLSPAFGSEFLKSSLPGAAVDADSTTWQRVIPVTAWENKGSPSVKIAVGARSDIKRYYYLAAGGSDGVITIYKVYRTHMELQQYNSDQGVATSKSRAVVEKFKSNEAGTITYFTQWKAHKGAITAIYFVAGAGYLVTASVDGTVKFSDPEDGNTLKIFTDSYMNLLALPCPSNPLFFVCGNDKAILRIVNSENGAICGKSVLKQKVSAACFSDNGKYFFAGSVGGLLSCYSTTNMKLTKIMDRKLSNSMILGLGYIDQSDTASKGYLAIASSEQLLRLFDFLLPVSDETGMNLKWETPLAVKVPFTFGKSSYGGKWLVAGTQSGDIVIFTLDKNGEKLTKSTIADFSVPSVSVSVNAESTLLVSSFASGKIAVWRRADRSSK